MKKSKQNKLIIIKTGNLREILDYVKDGISKELIRPAFAGIKVEADSSNLTFITCDGYKIFTASRETVKSEEISAIIPLFKIPREAENETTITFKDEQVILDFGYVQYVYKTIKGEFIDWKPYLERENKFVIRFNPKFLKEALKNVKGHVDLYFAGDREAVIIVDTSNTKNRKYVLPRTREE